MKPFSKAQLLLPVLPVEMTFLAGVGAGLLSLPSGGLPVPLLPPAQWSSGLPTRIYSVLSPEPAPPSNIIHTILCSSGNH